MNQVEEYVNYLKQFKILLKKQNLKYTEQREKILKILFESEKHISADDIFLIIKNDYSHLNIGIATIYRTLSLLEDEKLVNSISYNNSGKKYELSNKKHHDHIICEKCDKIVEFYDENIERIQEIVAINNGFKITNHSMQIYGICIECQEKYNLKKK